MSAYYNQLFLKDPVSFLQSYTVDIKTWFEGLGRSRDAKTVLGANPNNAASASKTCVADFEPVGGVLGLGVNTVQLQFCANAGIGAYWVPYHAGTGLPGYAEVLRANPAHNLVFTAGMNGCAFVVTDSPLGAAYMRVYHNQHPTSAGVNATITALGHAQISKADFADYGGPALAPGINPVAFNFMYYKGGAWTYVFQPQSFNALPLDAPKKQDGYVRAKSVF